LPVLLLLLPFLCMSLVLKPFVTVAIKRHACHKA
jgi:hypothetical protein